MSNLYKEINIWQKISEKQLVCYRIFERISDKKYAVQNVDYFSPPFDDISFEQFRKQQMELFLEVDIEIREKFFDTIEQAIEIFNNKKNV